MDTVCFVPTTKLYEDKDNTGVTRKETILDCPFASAHSLYVPDVQLLVTNDLVKLPYAFAVPEVNSEITPFGFNELTRTNPFGERPVTVIKKAAPGANVVGETERTGPAARAVCGRNKRTGAIVDSIKNIKVTKNETAFV